MSAVAAAPRGPVRFSLLLAGGLDAGTLPSVAPGVRAELALSWGRVSLGFGLAQLARVTELDERGQGVSAEAWQLPVTGRVRIGAGLEVGAAFEITSETRFGTTVSCSIPLENTSP